MDAMENADPRAVEHAWIAENMDFLRANHAGEWIAVQGDRLVAAGPRLKEVLDTARALGIADPLITAIQRKDLHGVMMFRRWR
jgi:hypothetical protein